MKHTPKQNLEQINILETNISNNKISCENISRQNMQKSKRQDSSKIHNSLRMNCTKISYFISNSSTYQPNISSKKSKKTRQLNKNKSKKKNLIYNKQKNVTEKTLSFNQNIAKKIIAQLETYKKSYFNKKNINITKNCVFHEQLCSQFFIKKIFNQKMAGLCPKCAIHYAKKQLDVKEIIFDQEINTNIDKSQKINMYKYLNQMQKFYDLKDDFFCKVKEFNLSVEKETLSVRFILDSFLKTLQNLNKNLIQQFKKQISFKIEAIQTRKNLIKKELIQIQKLQNFLNKNPNDSNLYKNTINQIDRKISKSRKIIKNTQFPDIKNFCQYKIDQTSQQFTKVYQNFIQQLFSDSNEQSSISQSSFSQDIPIALDQLKKNQIDISSESYLSQDNIKKSQKVQIKSYDAFSSENQSYIQIQQLKNLDLINNLGVSRSYNFDNLKESAISDSLKESYNFQYVVNNCLQNINSIDSVTNFKIDNIQNIRSQEIPMNYI